MDRVRAVALAAAMLLVVSSCGSPSGGGEDLSSSGEGDAGVPELECVVENYPCALTDVPAEILERSDDLSIEAVAMLESGSSGSDVEEWLSQQDGVLEVAGDEKAIRFRLEGGRGTWIFRRAAFGSRSAPGMSTGHVTRTPPGGGSFHIAAVERKEKRALVLSPMKWDFGELDEGAEVARILGDTRGYSGGVTYQENADPEDKGVGVESFRGWDEVPYQVVHVATHGTRICKEGTCRAVIAATTVRGALPKGEGILDKGGRLGSLVGRGLDIAVVEGSRGLVFDPRDPLRLVLLTADFFKAEYGSGLDDTLVFFNACESFGSNATDIADRVRGSTSVYLGWDETVSSSTAFAAAVELYRLLGDLGYPAAVAFEKLGALKSDPVLPEHANLVLGKRTDGDGLRIRDVVELHEPGSDVMLSPSSRVLIVGNQGDGQVDSVPYEVQVDGMVPELAPTVVLHVSVDGEEVPPVPITDGVANERDEWIVTGEASLGFDLEEETPFDIRAWVELHSGGESDEQTSASAVGGEPIMGYQWTLESTSMAGSVPAHATLLLEFEPGQPFDEPRPRYVVVDGSVVVEPVVNDVVEGACVINYLGAFFVVQSEMSPASPGDGAAPSVLTFDTTTEPVGYSGVIYTAGPEVIVNQTCHLYEGESPVTNPVSYGQFITWMLSEPDDQKTVIERRLIEGDDSQSARYHIVYTATRTR